MKDIQQLIKKNSQEGRYEDIFPKTFIDAVLDKESGVTLTDILAMFNMLFLSYNGSRSQTRLQVPSSLRREGLWVTYVLYDKTVVTEWYSAEAIDDTTFGDSANWRDGSNALVGDISISSDRYWVINGEVTNIKAQGEAGITPILRVGSNNHLQVSYTNGSSYVDVSSNPVFTQFRVSNNKLQQSTDLGESWSNISEELAYKFRESGNKIQMSKDLGSTWQDVSDYIAAWFRFTGTTGSSQADNVGKIQISRDNGATWSDLSGEFTNSLHIKGYVATVGTLPSTAVQGDIYGVGPTYDPSDTEHTNPIYQLYVKNSTGWVNNGRFTSISAGVVQETGNSETAVMSQKAVSWKFLADKSFSGRCSIDPNMLVSISSEGNFAGYNKASTYDAAWFQVMEDSGTINVTGATIKLMACFNSLEPVADSFISTIYNNRTIPAGTKLIIIDLEKAANEGKYPAYVDLVVTTDSTGATRKQVTELTSKVESININKGNDVQSISAEVIRNSCIRQSFITNIDYTNIHVGYYNTDTNSIVNNPNYTSYEYDMSKYTNKILHFKTYSSGSMWGIIFLDANGDIISKLYQSFSSGIPVANAIDNDIFIPFGSVKAYVNLANNAGYPASVYYDSGERTSCKYDIVPVNLKVRDLATRIGEPVVMLSHLIQLSGTEISPNGNILPSDGHHWDLAFLKLNPDNIDPVRLECNYPVFRWCWYNSDELNSTNYLGNNITGIPLKGATYCVLLFQKTEIANKQGYNNLRVYNQKGTLIDQEFALRKLTYTPLPRVETVKGSWINSSGSVSVNSNFEYVKFNIPDINQDYALTSSVGGSTTLSLLNFYDAEDNFLSSMFYVKTVPGGREQKENAPFRCPAGTSYILVNSALTTTEESIMVSQINWGDYYNLQNLETNNNGKSKLMKVHVYGVTTGNGTELFYVRTKYNDAKDIIMAYYTNGNGLISPRAAYIGVNTLTDAQIMTSTYLVSSHSDSTAPLFTMKEYWHLFAQHGYVIPTLANSVNMTSADVGALWQDQLGRQYNIGSVSSSTIQLLPVVTRGDVEGTDSRSWKTPTGPTITSLTHVSGGTVTTPITTVTSLNANQLRPIMEVYNRKMLVDGVSITNAGDYYCDEFQVSENQIGYDPAWVDTWFPTPVLKGVPEMVRFTWSYNFKGATCGVNTTIDIRRKVEAASYGATQQQTFLDKGDYKAMFIIPKAAPQAGIELDKPFNSPSTGSTSYGFFRNSTYLKDVNKPIDRLIGYLYNPNTKDYLIGMAAGLSIVSGDTVPEKRNANIAIVPNDSDYNSRLGSFSAPNNNKFYIAAVNSYPFKNDSYNFPNTYFKEINYYVSYFDPAENVGQVYWYKDGNSYVIYAHCQSAQDRIALNLPSFMEGLNVDIVEQTDGATLLSSTIQNGQLFVSYNNEANYIVVKTK